MNYRLSSIPSGVAGTDATVKEIARLVNYDLQRPQLRLLATRVLNHAHIRSKDHLEEAKRLYRFVVQRVRYQKDPVGLETVQSPTATLSIGAGDCDDLSGLLAALAMAVGIPARLRVIGHSEDDLVHIFPELLIGRRWYSADATEPGRGFGWRPKRFPVERVYNLDGGLTDMAGVNSVNVTRGQVKRAIRVAVTEALSANWQSGLIDLADVRGYLRVIDEGNFPSRKPLVVEPTLEAIREFESYIVNNRIGSLKPAGSSSTLEGLSGFLTSIWDAGKKAVDYLATPEGKKAIDYLATPAEERGPFIQISPRVTIPEGLIRAEATPAVAKAFGLGLGSATLPLLIAGAGVVLYLVLRR